MEQSWFVKDCDDEPLNSLLKTCSGPPKDESPRLKDRRCRSAENAAPPKNRAEQFQFKPVDGGWGAG
jgi:hypothetical protein